MMNNQEQNWANLFGDLPAEGISWHGTWTKYAPNQEVLLSYQGVRKFVPNQDHTVITHTNNYTFADGKTDEKQWEIDNISCNQPDGMSHPAFSSAAKTVSFGENATAVMTKSVELDKVFGSELFFRHQDWRASVVIMYDQHGDLTAITHIYEHQGSFSNEPMAGKIENISGNWRGIKQSMTPDLNISDPEEIAGLEIDPTQGKNETLFLPDRIVVNCPKKLEAGKEFELVAGKLVTDNQYKRLTLKYAESGDFMLFIREVFHRQD